MVKEGFGTLKVDRTREGKKTMEERSSTFFSLNFSDKIHNHNY